MFDLPWVAFIVTSLIILVIPGPGVAYVVARSLSQGRVAGLVSALGLSLGVFAHVFAALLGLSAILLSSAAAFAIVKYLGAAYLIYLGIQAIRSASSEARIDHVSRQPLQRLFLDGVIVSIFNPKIGMFFLAFLPQFVNVETGQVSVQILMLGTVYAILAFVTDGGYGIVAGSIKNAFGQRLSGGKFLKYATGGVLIGLGLKAALTTQRS